MGPHTSPSDQDRSSDSTADPGSKSARETDPTNHCRTDGGVSDRMASSVFADLAADDESVDTDAILGDTSPADLIDGSATPDPAIQAPTDLFDDAAFDDLLLPDRREGDEFLWIETQDSTPTTEPTWDHPTDDGTDRPAESDADETPRTATGSEEPASVQDQAGNAFDEQDTGYEEIDLGSIFAGAAQAGDSGDGGGRVPPRTDSSTEKPDERSSNEPTPDEPSSEASQSDSDGSQPDSADSSSNPTDTERSSTESSSRIRSLFASLRSHVPGL